MTTPGTTPTPNAPALPWYSLSGSLKAYLAALLLFVAPQLEVLVSSGNYDFKVLGSSFLASVVGFTLTYFAKNVKIDPGV